MEDLRKRIEEMNRQQRKHFAEINKEQRKHVDKIHEGQRKHVDEIFKKERERARMIVEGALKEVNTLVPQPAFLEELRLRIDKMIKEQLPDFDALFPPLECEDELRKRIDKIREDALPDLNALSRNVLQGQVKIALKKAQVAGELPDFEIPDIPVIVPKLQVHGDFSYPAMRLSSLAHQNPLIIAETIRRNIPETNFIDEIVAIPPGFINFALNTDYLEDLSIRILAGWVNKIISDGERVFQLEIGKGKKAQVEFVSANPTGPITIGHTRGAVVGDTMAGLFEAAGFDVQREYYYNNAGLQMMMLGDSLRLHCRHEFGDEVDVSTDFDEDYYHGDYLAEFAGDLADEYGTALIDKDLSFFRDAAESRMFDLISLSLDSININHDAFYNEATLFESGKIWQVLDQMLENGHIYEATHREGADEDEIADVAAQGYEPAIWFRSTTFGDEKDRVMVKSDGSPTYTLPDIAYHCDKLERGYDIAVIVLGTDHFSQAQVVKYGLQALGMDPDPVHVIFNQMVRAVRWNADLGDYETVKQSKRAGDFDTLDDLVQMTSADAVRYHMLARSPNSQLDFDVDQVVKQSNENPVYYIQNAYVRCLGIFREAEERGFSDDGADLSLLGADELKFIRKALELGNVIEQAVTNYEPHKIAFFAHELAAVFHPIYDKVRVLHSEVPPETGAARLRFYRAAAVVFYRLLRLMGMSAPDRM